METANINRSLRWGLLAGLVCTIITDLISLAIFLFMGESLPAFFALLGRSFLTLFNIQAAFPVWQGLALHYSIGLLTGLVVAGAQHLIGRLNFRTYWKAILISVIVIQVEGAALFYLMSVILNIPSAQMWLIYGLGCFLHLVWGTCFGTLIGYSRRHAPLSASPAAS